ncbi:MAG: hypothetical protein JST24_00880 [Acidobacteria bacterium]|nr:hypothetical protein [Acidobacteriota bacterium]
MTRPSPETDPRALALLERLHAAQAGLDLGPALAWERVAFAEAFAGPEPARRVGAFLAARQGGKPE